MKSPISSIESIEPDPKDHCLCGSKKIFRKCCKATYNTDLKDHIIEKYNKGRYNEALIACRSHITWYILCHRAHTIPLIEPGKPKPSLLQVDIDSMAALLNLLHQCYYKTGKSKQFPAAIDALSNAIFDPLWLNKINQEKALWYLLDDNDREKAFKEMQKNDIDKSDDPECLAIYLDICTDKISFQNKINILDRILSNTHDESYLLQYTVVKGLAYYLIEEIEDGCEIIESGINRYKSCKEGKRSNYGNYKLASALEMLGTVKNSTEAVSEAIGIYTTELQTKSYSHSGISMLSMEIAKCYAFLEKFDEAIKYYKISLENEPSELTKVFLARAYLNSGNQLEGRKLLASIDGDEFNDARNYDLYLTWVILAFISRSKSDIEQAKIMLKEAKAEYPIFIHQRDKLLIELHELKPMLDERPIKKIIKSLNRYILLQPNLFGIGININNIIEDKEDN